MSIIRYLRPSTTSTLKDSLGSRRAFPGGGPDSAQGHPFSPKNPKPGSPEGSLSWDHGGQWGLLLPTLGGGRGGGGSGRVLRKRGTPLRTRGPRPRAALPARTPRPEGRPVPVRCCSLPGCYFRFRVEPSVSAAHVHPPGKAAGPGARGAAGVGSRGGGGGSPGRGSRSP